MSDVMFFSKPKLFGDGHNEDGQWVSHSEHYMFRGTMRDKEIIDALWSDIDASPDMARWDVQGFKEPELEDLGIVEHSVEVSREGATMPIMWESGWEHAGKMYATFQDALKARDAIHSD